jgi:hypothetical protein
MNKADWCTLCTREVVKIVNMGSSHSKKHGNKILKEARVDTKLLESCNKGTSPNSKQKRLSVIFSETRSVRSNTIGGTTTNTVEGIDLPPVADVIDTPRKRSIVLLHVESKWRGKVDSTTFRDAVKKQLSVAESKDLLILYPEERCSLETFEDVIKKEAWEFKPFSIAGQGEEHTESTSSSESSSPRTEKPIDDDKVVEIYRQFITKFHIRKVIIVTKEDLNYTLNANILDKAEKQGTLLSLYVAGTSKTQRLKRMNSLRAAKKLGIPFVEGAV